MGSPDNRRKADDSCQALRAGRSLSKLHRDKQLVRFSCAARKGGGRDAAHWGIDLERGGICDIVSRKI